MAEPDDTIAALDPVLWWKLDGSAGQEGHVADSGSADAYPGYAAIGGTVGVLGADGFLPASTATVFDTMGNGPIYSTYGWPVPSGSEWSVVVFFQAPPLGDGYLGAELGTLVAYKNSGDNYYFEVYTAPGYGPTDPGYSALQLRPANNPSIGPGMTSRFDGRPHMFYMGSTATEYAYGWDANATVVPLDGGLMLVSPGKFVAGALDEYGNWPLNGKLAHVAVFDRYLTPAEALTIYEASGILPRVDLVGPIYPFTTAVFVHTRDHAYLASTLLEFTQSLEVQTLNHPTLNSTLDPFTGTIDARIALATLASWLDQFTTTISVAGPPPPPSPATLDSTLAPFTGAITIATNPPVNDNFANAAVLVNGVETSTWSEGATLESGESFSWADTGTLWWKFDAIAGKTVTITDASETYDYLTVYSPNNPGAPTVNALTLQMGGSGRASFSFVAPVTGTYYLQINVYAGGAEGYTSPGLIRLTLTSAPVNDDFANALVITPGAPPITGTTAHATMEAGEFAYPAGRPESVWYQFTVTQAGDASITVSSAFNVTVQLFGATSTPLPDSGSMYLGYNGWTLVRPVTPGLWHLRLTAPTGDSGLFQLSIAGLSDVGLASTLGPFTTEIHTLTTAHASLASTLDLFTGTIVVLTVNHASLESTLDPFTGTIVLGQGNNMFEHAFPLFLGIPVTGTNVGATAEPGEPAPPSASPLRSVWWRIDSGSAGERSLSTAGSSFDTFLAVYTGASVAGLTLVAQNDDDPAGGSTSYLTFNADAGVTYWVQVSGYAGLTGDISLAFSQPPNTASLNSTLDPFTGTITVAAPMPLSTSTDLPSIDGATTPIGPATVDNFDPFFEQIIDLGSIDGSSLLAGVVVEHFPIIEIPFTPVVTARLYDRFGNLLSMLDNASGIRWQDPFNDVGTGSITLPFDDPAAALMVASTEVRCYLYGELVYAWEVGTDPSLTAIDPGEEAAQEVSADGAGRVSLTGRARIYPVKGIDAQLMGQHRLYSFASPDFPNAAAWPAAFQNLRQDVVDPVRFASIEVTTQAQVEGFEDTISYLNAAAPLEWMVPTAYWIWNGPDTYPVGFCYFRGSFDLAGETKLVIAATADNYWTLYLDGNPILGETGTTSTWQEYKDVTLTLPAGHYTLAAAVENIAWPGAIENNPAGFLFAAYTLDEKKKVLDVIKVSDNTWTCLGYPASVPGWTPGQILIDAIAEAQARPGNGGATGNPPAGTLGAGTPNQFTIDFTAFADSSGGPWVTDDPSAGSFVPGFSVPIGGTVLDVLKGLEEQGWIDFRVKPGGMVLQVWSQGHAGQATSVALVRTGDVTTQNVVSLSFEPQGEPVTRLLVKWSQGFFQLDNVAAQGQWGVFEGYITVDAANEVEARRQAQLVLDELSNPQTSIVVETDPATLIDRPYLSYGNGDTLTIPDRTGAATVKKLLSITVDENDMGQPTIVLEFAARVLTRQREQFKLFDTLGRGVTGNTKIRNAALSETSDVSNG